MKTGPLNGAWRVTAGPSEYTPTRSYTSNRKNQKHIAGIPFTPAASTCRAALPAADGWWVAAARLGRCPPSKSTHQQIAWYETTNWLVCIILFLNILRAGESATNCITDGRRDIPVFLGRRRDAVTSLYCSYLERIETNSRLPPCGRLLFKPSFLPNPFSIICRFHPSVIIH